MEHLLRRPGLLTNIYPTLGLGERLFVLEVTRETLSRGTPLPADCIVLLAAEFKRRADAIFIALDSSSRTPEPTESAALLETIATASGLGDTEAAQTLKQDGSLLTSAVCKLIKNKQIVTQNKKLKVNIMTSLIYRFTSRCTRMLCS